MTTPDPSGGDQGERPDGPESPGDAPFLPAAPPTVKGSVAPAHAERGAASLPTTHGASTPAAGTTAAPDDPAAPHLPSAPAAVAGSVVAEPVEFDAKAMVESQKHYDVKPTYGALPRATPESIEAAKQLRAKAQKKRRRNGILAWTVLILLVGGAAVGGWYGYQAYQDDQDRRAAEQADEDAAEAETDRGALTALGEQQAALEANENLLDVARPSAGGLRDVVDDAEELVADLNDRGGSPGGEPGSPGEPEPAPEAIAVSLEDVRPFEIGPHSRQLADSDGFERYVIDGDEMLAADPAAYRAFVDTLRSLPQAAPGSPGLAVLPTIRPGQIGLAVRHADGVVQHVVALAETPALTVDLAL